MSQQFGCRAFQMKERLKTTSKSLFLGLVDKRHRMAGKVRQFKLGFTEFEETIWQMCGKTGNQKYRIRTLIRNITVIRQKRGVEPEQIWSSVKGQANTWKDKKYQEGQHPGSPRATTLCKV